MTEQRNPVLFARERTMETNLALAPAAGQGIGKQLFDRLLSDPQFLDDLAEAARDGLKAMTPRRWDKASGSWECDPDYRVRTQTLFGLLAQAEGEPIKRILHQHMGSTEGIDPLAALRDSPALLAAVKREVEKAEWRTSGKGEHKRPKAQRQADPVVEIEAPEK